MDLIERAAEHLEKNKSGLVPEDVKTFERPALPADLDLGLGDHGAPDSITLDEPPKELLEPPQEFLDPPKAKPARPPFHPGKSQGIELNYSTFKRNGLLLPFGKSTQLTEEFRHIKRDVLTLRNVEGLENSNMIMVTSAAPGEGKTHTAINLALSIASERDLTALLIDADFTRPKVLDRLGVSADRGLIDLLDDPSVDVSDVILRTNIESLSIIPAGPRHQRSTELLSSRRMHQIAEEIAQRYNDRVVIFDTAPLLATTEPAALVKHVGQILIVVEAEKTPKGALASAVDMVKHHRGVGFVLNKVRPQFGNALSGGYYNYYNYGNES